MFTYTPVPVTMAWLSEQKRCPRCNKPVYFGKSRSVHDTHPSPPTSLVALVGRVEQPSMS